MRRNLIDHVTLLQDHMLEISAEQAADENDPAVAYTVCLKDPRFERLRKRYAPSVRIIAILCKNIFAFKPIIDAF